MEHHVQTAPVRASPQHNEPAVPRYVIVCDGNPLSEVEFVGKKGNRLSKEGFSTGGFQRDRHHVPASTIEDLPAVAAPPRLDATSFRHLPAPVQFRIAADVN